MQYRTIGKIGEKKSILGFGCMRLPLTDPSNPESVDYEQASVMLHEAIEAGVNYVDTAYNYHSIGGRLGPGQSEPFVGRALKGGFRERVSVATKLPIWLVEKHEDMDRFLNHQLQRLQIEQIDYYLVHNINSDVWEPAQRNGVFDFLDRVRKDGRVRHVGFSFHDRYELFEEVMDAYDWEFAQIQFNYLDVNYQAGLRGLKRAAGRDLGVVIMEPLRGGFLTNYLPREQADLLASIRPEWSLAEWALRWIWHHPEVKVVLSGMSHMDQVMDNLAAADKAEGLTDEELAALTKVRKFFQERLKINCTSCGYCLPCPEGVCIPKCFAHFNNYYLMDAEEVRARTKFFYGSQLAASEKADKCVGCGRCEERCPQHLPISELMTEVKSLFHGA